MYGEVFFTSSECAQQLTQQQRSHMVESFFYSFLFEEPRIVTRASSRWHKRANLLPDIYFSDTRFRCSFVFERGRRAAHESTDDFTSSYWLSAKAFLLRPLPLRKRFLIFKWRNHGIYETHFSDRINNRLVGAHGSASQIFFNLCQSTKDDTWDVMRGDRRVEFEVSDVIPIKAHVP